VVGHAKPCLPDAEDEARAYAEQVLFILVAKGQELTSAFIMRLTNYSRATAIDKEVMVFVAV
jgi:hypothetical protein